DWPAISCGEIATLFGALGLVGRRAPALPGFAVVVRRGLASLLSVVFCRRCSTTVGGSAAFVFGAGLGGLAGVVVFGGAGGGAIVVEVVVDDGLAAASGLLVCGVELVAGVEAVPSGGAGVLAACA